MAETRRIRLSRPLAAAPDAAYQLVVDIERFPEFMDNVMKVEVLEASADRKLAAWETQIDGAPVEWIEEGIYDAERRRVAFRSVDGIFDRFDGEWQVTARDGGCHIDLVLDYVIGLDEIEDIIGPILEERLTQNLASMLDGLERWAGAR